MPITWQQKFYTFCLSSNWVFHTLPSHLPHRPPRTLFRFNLRRGIELPTSRFGQLIADPRYLSYPTAWQ